MFNLEQAITDWRRRMLSAGIKTPLPLLELEEHLREDVEMQLQAGVPPEQAFEIACRRIGEASSLKAEFVKAGRMSALWQPLITLTGLLLGGFILCLSSLTFFEMQLDTGELLIAFGAVAFTLTAAYGWRYAVPFLPIITSHRKRMAIGATCVVAGFLGASFICSVILPHFVHGEDRQLPAVGFWAVSWIAVFTCLGIGLMLDEEGRNRWGMIKSSTH